MPLTIFSVFLTITSLSWCQSIQVSSGTMKRFENFPSAFVSARHVDVWLPMNYSEKKKYAVLYMHDGQMLFDSTATWNKQEWGVDETISRLIQSREIKDCIVVGIWNSGVSRHIDYFPQKPFESLTKPEQDSVYQAKRSSGQSVFSGKVQSDLYLKFLVAELKPFIDKNFVTRKDQANTFIAGSSMGGLISLYAICEYPTVFGGAACLSTHWPGIFELKNNPIPAAFISYLQKSLPDPASHKIYFDYGTATLDAWYPPLQTKVDVLMKEKGFTHKNWVTKEFAGADHSEKAWQKRFDVPVLFLLAKQ